MTRLSRARRVVRPGRFTSTRDAVRELVELHGCEMMKLSTEDEALTHADVEERYEVFAPLVTVELKIGGPGARGDLALCRRLGIRHIIAPMIESEYGLRDYLAATLEVRPRGAHGWHLGINIETEIAVRHVGDILAADSERCLAQVTVGRGDLSKSLRMAPDDEPVTRRTRTVVALARKCGYTAGVGGGIDPGNVAHLLERVGPDGINTRNFAFAASLWRRDAGRWDLAKAESAVRAALEAEILMLRAAGGALASRRVAALRDRLRKR